LSRPRTLYGECEAPGCDKPKKVRNWCKTHYNRWNEHAHRCRYPDCTNFQRDGGRRSKYGHKTIFYCREHEGQHLCRTPWSELTNAERLAQAIDRDEPACWIYTGPTTNGGYGLFVPEGGGKQPWLAHRAMWALLLGGHKPKLVLDHLCERPACINPAHLEPVTRTVNERRKVTRPSGPNWDAAKHPAVASFAALYGLPLPSDIAAGSSVVCEAVQ
jgi:hypothetical protein